ncbi:S-acyl fatty acid synthase thioesterase, medium chain isoform X2 [Hippoglossus stenolepis]|uniref:S-acyl fatty acid synthase thioesterase, medium chain isoform X2 n=1 Tax=Hippoglossus stenolepis TaxID=195615 RepID=UPI00159C4D1A|nr:S-acyl fatty acid synthase thioesterase, medium chain isoform X2 [Hippoglossus stenolepis]
MEKVINCFKRNPEAVARLICFPWAGGGSLHYARWGNLLSSVEVFAVKLPGRESRTKEPFAQSMQQIVDEVIDVLLPLLKEKPFALFGHSFGAYTSFAVADALKKLHNLQPVHIFLSGVSAPYSEIRIKAPKRSDLSDDDFLKWLTSIGGTPPELLGNPEVMERFLPVLKADLHVVENYRFFSAGVTNQTIHSCPALLRVLTERTTCLMIYKPGKTSHQEISPLGCSTGLISTSRSLEMKNTS